MSVRRPAVRRVPGPLLVIFSSAQLRAACHARHTRARRVGGAPTAAGGVAATPYGKCRIKKARYPKRCPIRIPYVDPLPKVAWTVERTSQSLWLDPT